MNREDKKVRKPSAVRHCVQSAKRSRFSAKRLRAQHLEKKLRSKICPKRVCAKPKGGLFGQLAEFLSKLLAATISFLDRLNSRQRRLNECSSIYCKPAATHGLRQGGGPSTGDPKNTWNSGPIDPHQDTHTSQENLSGKYLHATATMLFDSDALEYQCEPAIAELQHDYIQAYNIGADNHQLSRIWRRHAVGILKLFLLLFIKGIWNRFAQLVSQIGAK